MASTPSHASGLNRFINVLGVFLVGQFTAQLLNAITGITLVRWLPKNEYAWLTIANAMTASFSVMLDPAIGVGLQVLASPVRQDQGRLLGTLGEALRWRWLWMGWITLAVLPLSVFLLFKSGASTAQTAAVLTVTLLGLPALTAGMIFGTVPKLRSELRALQMADVTASVARLVMTAGLLLLAKLAALAAFATTASQWVQSKLLQRSAMSSLKVNPTASPETSAALSVQMKQMLPHSLFLCVQGHIGIWLLGFFGTVEGLADLGALTRLGILLASVGVFAQQVLIPALSRHESAEKLARLAIGSLALGLGSAFVLVALSWFFPWPFLWLLGPQYGHLHTELAVAMVFFSLSTLSTINWWFNASRGWIAWAKWVPFLSITSYAITAWLLRPSTTLSALQVLISGQAASLTLGVLQSWRGMKRMPLRIDS